MVTIDAKKERKKERKTNRVVVNFHYLNLYLKLTISRNKTKRGWC